MNKKINIVILLLIVICLFLITTTIAFITRKINTNNIITFGSIKMQLIQTTLNENNKEEIINNNEKLDITNSSTISRIVKIKNVGNHEFYARVSLDIIGEDAEGQKFNANKTAFYNINTEDWVYKDGWYYYKKIVKQNDITSNLITQISFDINSLTTNYPKGIFKFNIKAEAVQAQNNAENVLDVEGWPSN